MRNNKLIFLIVLLLALMLPGCANSKKSETKEKLNVFIDIKDNESIDLLNKLIEDYKGKNPKINLNTTSVLENNTDVIFTTRTNMINFADKGYLKEMKDYIDENKIDERYYKIVKLYGRYNDKDYGIPIILNPLEIYYNEDSIKRNNLTIPVDKTGLLKLLQELRNKSIQVPVMIPEKTEEVLFAFIVNNTMDVTLLDKNFDLGIQNYNNINEMKIPFDILKDIIRKNILGKSSFIKSEEKTGGKMEKGEVPILISNNLVQGSNIKVFQNYSKGIVPVSSKLVASIYAGSENSKQGEDFIKYIFSDETQKILNEEGCISGNKTVNNEKTGVEKDIFNQLGSMDEKSIAYFDTIPDKLKEAVQERIEIMLSGKFSENEWYETIKSAF
ncbi:MAG: ABC transporter substrate-binding protein [Solirubrobacterales bacterium]